MRYYEWELDYLNRLITQKEKAVGKPRDSYITQYKLERELEALRTIRKVVENVVDDFNHLLG